jgi:DNA mismatch repair protein MutS
MEVQADESGVIDGINTGRYVHKKSYLFAVPLVHTFLYSLYEQEHQLAPLFASIAEIDAYNAIATKVLEAQAQQNKFCFATVIDSEKPAIETAGFWNVLVKKPVVNSISEAHTIILTGPNAGGKTTAIRALLQNVILAQTYGVAAAEQFACTPFEVIHSYLNVSDDLINGLSLFASEVKRAQGIVETIKNLQPGEKYFCALDELFTGTVAEDGEACAYQFVKRITQCDSALFIYATHFGKLTTLEADNIGCINYKVDAPTKDANGHLVYPYTLNRGINDARVALDLANQANLFA